MATRKVLINRHTSGNTAPVAGDMYKGEIAVQHKTGEEILWTKNNDDIMVPFISCAQTISIIDDKIKAVNVIYDVKKGENEPHIEVERSQEGSAVTFTLTSNDIASKAEYEAYSARTNNALTALTKSVADLLDITVTGISGDTIIVAEPVENGTGSNAYNLTHKRALATDGFNKLATDAYGHVTAATAVATADIEALGFKTSAVTDADLKIVSGIVDTFSAATVAEFNSAFTAINTLSSNTEAAIEKAINDLDSVISASTTGNYITAIEIKDGKLQKVEEAAIPVLEVESAGTGNVVSSIAVDDHKITYQTVSVATSEDINELSAATVALSAGTVHDLEELSGATKAISGYAHDEIAALSAGTIQLSADTKATIGQLSAGTIMVSGYAHGEIVELSGAVQANETDIDNLSAATLALSAVTLTGVSLNNTPLTVTDHVVSVPVADDKSDIAGATATGNVADAKAVKDYVEDVLSSSVDYKGATAGAPTGTPSKGDLYIASGDFTIDGKNVETGDFIIYNGESWDVIEKNLDGAITGNLTADTVTLGDSTNSVKSLANGTAGQVLTIGTAGTPVWADDPVLSTATTGMVMLLAKLRLTTTKLPT